MITLAEAQALDAADPFASWRDRFVLPEGTIYLDGNSLGPPLRSAAAALAEVVTGEWGDALVAGWNRHDWIGLPERLGARIARLIGAAPGEVIVCDSVSVNLFKLIGAVLQARPDRRTILTEAGNFPTDLYIAQGAARLEGCQVRTVAADQIVAAIDDDTALVLLTHVHYKSGDLLDMAAITRAAHARGALVLWDLSHSTGAVPVDLGVCDADLAVGCGYKYLNGGPGAPAFLYVAQRLHAELHSPLSGWMGHAAPFAFVDDYAPAHDIRRFLCGTPPVLAMAALDHALGTFDGIEPAALYAKGGRLADVCIALMEARLVGHGFTLLSPRDAAARGSHVSYAHSHAWPISQALIARGVVGDFRAPDALRFGFAPLYTGYAQVWQAVDILAKIMASGEWQQPQFSSRAKVT